MSLGGLRYNQPFATYIGMYYIQAARYDLKPMFELTAFGRLVVLPALNVSLYLSGKVTLAWLEAAIPSECRATPRILGLSRSL